MSINLLQTDLMKTVSQALDLTTLRQSLVTENIANIDTPGYQTQDIDFRQELERAMNTGTEQPLAYVREVPGLIARPDGNNVSIDRESLLMAQNQLQYQAEIQVLRSEFSRLQMAINGGTGQ